LLETSDGGGGGKKKSSMKKKTGPEPAELHKRGRGKGDFTPFGRQGGGAATQKKKKLRQTCSSREKKGRGIPRKKKIGLKISNAETVSPLKGDIWGRGKQASWTSGKRNSNQFKKTKNGKERNISTGQLRWGGGGEPTEALFPGPAKMPGHNGRIKQEKGGGGKKNARREIHPFEMVHVQAKKKVKESGTSGEWGRPHLKTNKQRKKGAEGPESEKVQSGGGIGRKKGEGRNS